MLIGNSGLIRKVLPGFDFMLTSIVATCAKFIFFCSLLQHHTGNTETRCPASCPRTPGRVLPIPTLPARGRRHTLFHPLTSSPANTRPRQGLSQRSPPLSVASVLNPAPAYALISSLRLVLSTLTSTIYGLPRCYFGSSQYMTRIQNWHYIIIHVETKFLHEDLQTPLLWTTAGL